MEKEKGIIPEMQELTDSEVSGITGGTLNDHKSAGYLLEAGITELLSGKLTDHDRRVLKQLGQLLIRIANGGSSIKQNYSTATALVSQIQDTAVRAKASHIIAECKSLFWR